MKYEVHGFSSDHFLKQEISQREFKRIKAAKRKCLAALRIEENFALMFENYAEFEIELLRLAENSLVWKARALEYDGTMRERLLLDRRLSNLLTSCTLYRDQSARVISGLCGKKSTESVKLSAFKNTLAANHLGYRFMEALRNHIQHFSLAVWMISKPYFLVHGIAGDYIENTVSPRASVKALREDSRFGEEGVLDELARDQDDIDLRVPIREYMSCLASLHGFVRDLIAPSRDAARNEYESATKFYDAIDGEQIKFAILREFDDANRLLDEVQLVTHFLSYYDDLMKQNEVNKNIHNSVASNAIQRRS